MTPERLLLVAQMQIVKLKEELEAAKKAEAKAAAFDWLMVLMQEAYDQGRWIEVGDVSIGAQLYPASEPLKSLLQLVVIAVFAVRRTVVA